MARCLSRGGACHEVVLAMSMAALTELHWLHTLSIVSDTHVQVSWMGLPSRPTPCGRVDSPET